MKMFRGFRAIVIAVTAAAAAASIASANKKPGQSGELKNIVIEGVTRMQLKGDKPNYSPSLDAQKPLGEFLLHQLDVTNPLDKMSPRIPTLLPSPISADIILSPWRRNLMFPPVLDLAVEAPPRVKISHWRFIITSDQGKVFRVIKGKNHLPDHITWDGMSNTGSPLEVGHPYAYSLSVLDRAGVPTYLSGKTVRLSSFVDEGMTSTTLYLDTEVLFNAGHEFSQQGFSFLREIQDTLRGSITSNLSVKVYGIDSDLAQREADSIRKHLEKVLHLAEGKISAKGYTAGKGEYLRTEIAAKAI